MIDSAFLDWMETASPSRRVEVVRMLAARCADPMVADAQRGAIEAAMTLLLDDPSPMVRRALAEGVASSILAPRHVVLALAADQPDVAAIVLGQSPLFIDAELVDVVGAADESLQPAIARRDQLSNAVAASVAEVGTAEACLALLANETASIARISFRRMAERFGDDAPVRTALLGRDDLPADVRQLLVRRVSDALAGMHIARAWVSEARLRNLSQEACERATVAIAAESETEELPALVEHLRVTEQLTTALILRAVCAGNIPFFETALAVLARVPRERVVSLVRAGRLSALRAVYVKAELPLMAFDAFCAAIDTWREAEGQGGAEDRYRFTCRIVERVLARYSDITAGEANELAAMLRRFAAEQTRDAARAAVSALSVPRVAA